MRVPISMMKVRGGVGDYTVLDGMLRHVPIETRGMLYRNGSENKILELKGGGAQIWFSSNVVNAQCANGAKHERGAKCKRLLSGRVDILHAGNKCMCDVPMRATV